MPAPALTCSVSRQVVSRSQTLVHTAMVVAAMTAHGDVVTWCVDHTAARPWIVAKALVCVACCIAGSCTLSHMCEVEDHKPHQGWGTAAVLAACSAGDVSLLRRLIREHAVLCDAGVRRHTLRDKVSVCCMRLGVVCARQTADGLACRDVVVREAGRACRCGRLDVARWLVTGADSDARSERSNVSSFCHSVCELGLVVMVRCFLLFRVVLTIRMATRPFGQHVRAVTLMLHDGS
jgi:hypothetical protein